MISIVVLSYEMRRELPRTLYTLSRMYQRGVESIEYEVLVVDNGSKNPISASELECYGDNFRGIWIPQGQHRSPCVPINRAASMANGDLIGVLIDGARMVTPGLIKLAATAMQLGEHAVVSALSWHLGSQPQNKSMQQGYCQTLEDELLSSINWQRNGYELFNIACLAPSSRNGYFGSIFESNAIFMTKTKFQQIGGFDENFILPGGGFANLDFYKRLVETPGTTEIRLIGEGTFHQFHGGIATNDKSGSYVERAANEYFYIKGGEYKPPNNIPLIFGVVNSAAIKEIGQSVEIWMSKKKDG